MSDVFRRRSVRLALCSLALSAAPAILASAQSPTELHRQLSRVDIGLSGMGQFRSTVNGTNYQDIPVQQKATTGFGGLVTLRYTKSPLLGAEFNYSFTRYNENFSTTSTASDSFQYLGVQTRATEYTLGYVAHLPISIPLLGIKPFAAAGLGATGFYPTKFGGASLPVQARATYYFGVGAEAPLLTSHLGLRGQYRQLFYLAPDFGQNYLTIKQHTTAIEPTIGLYVHF